MLGPTSLIAQARDSYSDFGMIYDRKIRLYLITQ